MWEELSSYKPLVNCTCGGSRPLQDRLQMEHVMAFLMGLNDSFSQVRGQILLMDPLPPINRVFSLILQEEKQREVGGSSIVASAQVVFASKTDAPRGNGEGKPKQGKKDRPLCTHCNILGHTIDKCYKLHGYPPGYGKFKRPNPVAHQVSDDVFDSSQQPVTLTSAQYQKLLSLLTTQNPQFTMDNHDVSSSGNQAGIICSAGSSLSTSNPHCWIVDSGATSHITFSLDTFLEYKPMHNYHVSLPNGSRVSVAAVGSVSLSASLILQNVLYIPDFKVNLLSVPALLSNSNYSLTFTPDHCLVQDLSISGVIGKANLFEGLYVLQQVPTTAPATGSSVSFSFPSVHAVSIHTWHARFGHLSNKILSHIASNRSLQINSRLVSDCTSCTVCPLAKLRRLSFVSLNNMSSTPFELVHCDVWGPYHVPTYNAKRYFLTIVEDCTRFSWV